MPARHSAIRPRRAAPPTAASSAGRLNKATVRVLNVLSQFIGRRSSWGVTELTQELSLSKNMVYRALNTLLEQGYVVRDATGTRYELGYRVLDLNTAQVQELDIATLCRPAINRLHDIAGESVFLSIIVGRNHITIEAVEAHGIKVSHNPRGLPVPLHASPASRALLAFLHDDEIAEYIRVASPLRRFTEHTITDPDKLWAEVRLVRRQRYAKGYGDHYTAGTYIAFPVLDASERPHAAITVGGPVGRFPQARVDALLPQMLSVMEELNLSSRLFPAASMVFFS